MLDLRVFLQGLCTPGRR